MLDLGLIVTAAAAAFAFAFGRGNNAIRAALFAHWLFVVGMVSLGLDKATTVFVLTSADFLVAGVAVLIAGHQRERVRTRIVGFLALLVMPLHMIMSATTGKLNWQLYAASLNLVFVLQCLIAAGVCDGLARRLVAFHDWIYGPSIRRTGGE